MTEAEKGVILRELRCDCKENAGFRQSTNKNPAKGIARAGLERSRRCDAQRRRFDYCAKNTAIPPLGNPTPPAVAEGPLVNGEKTKPPPVNTECELLPLGTLAATVCDAPLTTVSIGVRTQAALPPPQELLVAVARLVARNQLPDPAS